MMTSSDVERLLKSWTQLNDELLGLPREDVERLLREAVNNKYRWQVIQRIYSRFNRLRMLDELRDLKKGRTL